MGFGADLAKVQDAHLRLAVLRLLQAQPAYTLNDSVLHEAVGAIGLPCTRDQMRGHLGWLTEQRLATTAAAGTGLIIATLTERGSEVAAGRSVVAGVQRPSPKG